MIRALATKSLDSASRESLVLYREMLGRGLLPDAITLPFLLKECSRKADLVTGRTVHAHGSKLGYEHDVYVGNSLINLYCECGDLEDAWKVFDEMPEKDVVSWNSIIVGCLRGGEIDLALGLFREMPERKNVITWNSMITGLVQAARPKEALEIFHEMRILSGAKDFVCPDKVTVASVLSACASLGAITHGRWVHGYLERSGVECDVVVATALVDMYGKCGFVGRAFRVFKGMPDKDTSAWTVMISAFALHGYVSEAIELFEKMGTAGVRPNAVTYVGLLSACAHAGLVERGRWFFDAMKHVYRIEPQVEHYACMVDTLGRAGFFDEAGRLIRSMPMQPDVFVWGALLGACQLHGNVELGEKVARMLIQMDPQNHAFYIILCDLYAKSGRFDDHKMIRSLMEEQELRKSVPGGSTIEVNGMFFEFSVKGSPQMPVEALQHVLMLLHNEMKIKHEIFAC